MRICRHRKKILSLLVAVFLVFSISCTIIISANDDSEVYLGGFPFGIRFSSGEVTVMKFNHFVSSGKKVSPALDAGIEKDDVIMYIGDKKIESVYDVVCAVKQAKEDILSIVIKRDEQCLTVKIIPQTDDNTGEKQLGIMLKDSSAGIGTITFIEKDLHTFAGLGHGICDIETGEILKIETGYISNVKICGINKGKSGVPGELRGVIDSEKCGKLLSNTEVGVLGVFADSLGHSNDLIEVSDKNSIKIGKATILCTLDDNIRQEYDIEITEIHKLTSSKTKNFVIKVTDADLLNRTGGIVQGMSGSPIIQNGKLVGAVTHVMVNDPTVGYGIFIENMLNVLA